MQAAYLLSHCLPDLDSLVAAQSEAEKLRSELQSRQLREDRLAREVKTLQGRLDKLSGEKARVEGDCDELKAKNADLQSRQKRMMDEAFSLIMTEVWSVDPELVVPRVEKYVNKAAILRTIEAGKRPSPARSGTPSGSPGVPHLPERLPTSDVPASAVHISGTSESFADRPLEKDGEDDAPPSA